MAGGRNRRFSEGGRALVSIIVILRWGCPLSSVHHNCCETTDLVPIMMASLSLSSFPHHDHNGQPPPKGDRENTGVQRPQHETSTGASGAYN